MVPYLLQDLARVGESNFSSAMPKACADYARAEVEFSNKHVHIFCATNKQKGYLNLTTPLRPFSDMPSNEAFRAPQAIATNEGRLCTPTQSKTATPDQKTILGAEGPDPLPAPAYFQLN
jgi:hypothetical protein